MLRNRIVSRYIKWGIKYFIQTIKDQRYSTPNNNKTWITSCPWCWVNPSNHHPRCKEKHTRIIYATVQTNKKSSVERLTPSNDVTWAYVRRTSTSQCEGAHDAFSESHNICMTWGRSMKKRYIMWLRTWWSYKRYQYSLFYCISYQVSNFWLEGYKCDTLVVVVYSCCLLPF